MGFLSPIEVDQFENPINTGVIAEGSQMFRIKENEMKIYTVYWKRWTSATFSDHRYPFFKSIIMIIIYYQPHGDKINIMLL